MAIVNLEYTEINGLLYPKIEIGGSELLKNLGKYGRLRLEYLHGFKQEMYRELLFTGKWVYPDFCVNSKQRCKTEQNMKGRQRHDRCRLFTNITLTWTDVKGGEAACIPLTSGAGGVTRASGQQRRWPSARGSHTNSGGVRSTFS